jgi:hypothetical protein
MGGNIYNHDNANSLCPIRFYFISISFCLNNFDLIFPWRICRNIYEQYKK